MLLSNASPHRLALAAATTLMLGCSTDASDAGPAASPDASVDTPDAAPDGGAMEPERPPGPTAEAELLTGGNGIFLAAASATELPEGWIEEEYALAGTATSYIAEGNLPADGTFSLREGASDEYRTRIAVRRPESASDFNGTVIVEWLNVSGGVDANPDFTYLADELLRGGYAWVGVSAQHVGVEGGPVLVLTPVSEEAGAGKGLRALDPERYESLHHPGDAFAYDIFTQVARTLRLRVEDGILGELRPTRILAVGESQSAFMLTTYANGVHPRVRQYDGFLIHSRGGGSAPLGEPGAGIDLVSGITGAATRIRTDLEEPTLMLESETDLLFVINYYPARQPDTDTIRTWEMAGTAHADAYLLGGVGDLLECGAPINAGPHHFVAKAALRHLDAWARGGDAPPEAPRLEIRESADGPAFVRDENGNVLGGIRTPQVEVPVDTLSGEPVGGSIACTLFGSTSPLPSERLAELYASPEAYVDAYTKAADVSIEAGFVLAEDRDALLADAVPERIQP